jgi:hypothetical protein
MPGKAGSAGRRVAMPRATELAPGEAGHWGGRAEPPPLRGGARRGLPAARSASPVRSARGTRRNERALAIARTASGHEQSGDDAKPRLDPAKLNLGTCAVQGEERSLNLSRAPTASLRDGLRPLLTEPFRQPAARRGDTQ